jgi:hypothetical protein
MNPRLQQLADQCTNQYRDDHGGYIDEIDIETFAELIVRECAETIQDFVEHRFPASEYPGRLKNYFGVQE